MNNASLYPALLHANIEQNVKMMREVVEDAASQLGKEINFKQARDKLDSLQEFLIVVVGEWNRGKSTLINKLLDQDCQRTGNMATTESITSFKYGSEPSTTSRRNVTEIRIDNKWLRCLGASIVDTPGCNSLESKHDTVSRTYLPMADVVVLVMSIDQPLSGSERLMLEQLLLMKKHIVYVINKSDYKTPQEITDITQQVTEGINQILLSKGHSPHDIPLFVISCKHPDETISALRTYLTTHLCASTRTELKLESLVSCIQQGVDKCMQLCEEEDHRLLPIMKAQFENNNQYEALEQELLKMKTEIVKHIMEECEITRERGRFELSSTKNLELMILLRPLKIIEAVRRAEGDPAVQATLTKFDSTVRDSLYKFQDHSRSRLVKTSELPEDTDMQMCGARYRGFIPDETSRTSFAEHVQPPMTKVIQKVTSVYPLSFPLTTPKKVATVGSCAVTALTATGNPLAAVLACCASLSVLPFSMRNSCLSHYDILTTRILREMESETAACWDRNVLDQLDVINVRYAAFYTALKGESENNERRKRYLSDISDTIGRHKNEATTKLRKLKHDFESSHPDTDPVEEG